MVEVKYDQHFLEDSLIIDLTIKEANINPEDIIFEIGPGKGVLTKAILNCNPKQLISVELDEMLKNDLVKLGTYSNLKLIFANALDEISNHDFTKLVANIPYAITESLYEHILARKIPFSIILHGKTFYDTIIRRDSKWNIYVNAFYDIILLKEVLGESFSPRTKTRSALVKLELKKDLSKDDLFIQNLFFKRKSKVKNAIIEAFVKTYNLTKKEAKLKYDKLNIDVLLDDSILDNLSNEKFVGIVKNILLVLNI